MMWERRADMVSALGAAFVSGWVSCSGYYSIEHLWQKQNQLVTVETKVLPKVQTELKQADCDRTKLAGVAAQAIASANNLAFPAPDYSDIRGCKKVAPVKPPPIEAVIKK